MTANDHVPLRKIPALPTDMGEMRTIMGADRTLMAWIRTGLSMISFGFTIYKFLEGAAPKNAAVLSHPESPQRVGLFLCALGTLSIVLGTWSYWQMLRDLNRAEQFRLGRPVLFIALVMSLAGLGLFFAIASRLV
jgi:putative membrane protein